MTVAYSELLDATIQYLEDLKARGVRHVAVEPESLRALAMPPPPVATASKASFTPAPEMVPVAAAPPAPLVISVVPENVPAVVPATAPIAITGDSASIGNRKSEIPLAILRERALACRQCPHLAASRKNVVFGVGNPEARLMFVGEAPGADEDAQGEPFVGRAGELLTKIIQAAGLTRTEVYIANILKCRPDTPGQASGNRKPTPAEMATCLPYLHEQIDLIQPQVIVALGATAVEGLLGKTVGITRLRGHWQTYRGTPLMPTYHPAYLLRNQAGTEKRKVWEDMLAIMEKLNLPISEKQRNYFLKK